MSRAVCPGGILLSLLTLLDRGDEILLPDPNFMLYRQLVGLCEAEPRFYDLDDQLRIDPAQVDALVSDKTKIVFVNSPSNPTGAVLDADSIDVLVQAAKRVGAWVISDEIYDGFLYQDEYASPLGRYDRVIQLGGFSKTWGVPGWRMGYATGPAEVLDPMKTLQQFTYVCAPAPFQHAILEAAFDCDMSSHIEEYRGKRDRLVAELDPAYDLVPPVAPSTPGRGSRTERMRGCSSRLRWGGTSWLCPAARSLDAGLTSDSRLLSTMPCWVAAFGV